ILFRTCWIEPYDTSGGSEPYPPIGTLDGRIQGTQLSRKSRQSLPLAKMLPFDLISGVLQHLCDFGAADVKDATQAIEPKVPVGLFHNSRDAQSNSSSVAWMVWKRPWSNCACSNALRRPLRRFRRSRLSSWRHAR